MHSIVKQRVARFANMHGWANRILRVDLGDMSIDMQEAAPYVPQWAPTKCRWTAVRCWSVP